MSKETNYIIVNNEAGSAVTDGVDDLGRYMDMRSKGETSVGELAAELKSILASSGSGEPPLPAETQQIFVKIAELTPVLLRAPPSEFESAFNLHWYVLSSAPDFDGVIPIVLDKLSTSRPKIHAQQLALLAVLGSLFNITSSKSPQKPKVFSHLLDLAREARSTDQIITQLPQLAEWLRDWQMTDDEKVELVKTLVSSATSLQRTTVRDFLMTLVSKLPDLAPLAALLLTVVLEDPTAYKLDPVLSLPAVQAQKGKSDGVYEAVSCINVGDYSGFVNINTKSTTTPAAVRKAKVAAVARLCSSVDGELPYNVVTTTLGIPESEVEAIIIDGIKVDLIKGRMNQLQKVFFVESAHVVGSVNDNHWDAVEARLALWRKSLNAIVDVTNRARSNHDLVKTLNKLEVN